jgi:hypothetical protein
MASWLQPMAFNVKPQEFHNNAVSLLACASCSGLTFPLFPLFCNVVSNFFVAVFFASPNTNACCRSFNPAKKHRI